MQTLPKYLEILKNNNSRNTNQKMEVFLLFINESRPISATFIIKSLPMINKSSVYRILDLFIKLNIIKTIPRGFKTLYEISDIFHPHHHHITCEACGKTHALASNRLEKLIHELSLEADMIPSHHHIELYGFCKNCKNK